MDEPQGIDLQQAKHRVAQARVHRELTDRLRQVIRESQGNTVAVTHDFMPLFPGFVWEEKGIVWKAELIRPTYRITQMNKPTEEDSNEAG
jgi:hypothetical protein